MNVFRPDDLHPIGVKEVAGVILKPITVIQELLSQYLRSLEDSQTCSTLFKGEGQADSGIRHLQDDVYILDKMLKLIIKQDV